MSFRTALQQEEHRSVRLGHKAGYIFQPTCPPSEGLVFAPFHHTTTACIRHFALLTSCNTLLCCLSLTKWCTSTRHACMCVCVNQHRHWAGSQASKHPTTNYHWHALHLVDKSTTPVFRSQLIRLVSGWQLPQPLQATTVTTSTVMRQAQEVCVAKRSAEPAAVITQTGVSSGLSVRVCALGP
jgi:hypothetical protein